MVVCKPCGAMMRCKKNGHGVRVGVSQASLYPGDLYQCPKCKAETIVTNDAPYYDPISNHKNGLFPEPFTFLQHE